MSRSVASSTRTSSVRSTSSGPRCRTCAPRGIAGSFRSPPPGGQTTYPNFSYYHASKWGIEGFCETVAQEIAPFGIDLTIVEPGATPTNFGASLDTATIMPEYDAGPAGDVRRGIASGAFPLPNDPAKVSAAIIDAATETPARRRVPLGIDTYRDVRAAYVRRLQEHDALKDRAESVAATSD